MFLDLVGFGIVIPLLPLYAKRFGAGPVAVAWLLAVYSLMQFFFAPWWGRVSDRVGRRPVMLVGLFGAAASYLACGLAGSLAVLFAARVLSGVTGATVGVAQAYVADVTGPADRAKGMGMIGAAFGIGFIVGPALGGALSGFGPAVPFFAAAALALMNGVAAAFRLPESLPAEGRDARRRGFGLAERARALFGAGTPGRLRALYLAGFLATLAFAAMEGTFSLWADARWHATRHGIAYLFAYMGIVSVIAQGGVVGRLAKRIGERNTALVGGVLLAAGLAGVAAAPTVPLMMAALAVLAFGQGTTSPAVSSLVSRQGSAADQGRLLGVNQSLSALGRVIGPVCGGIALAHVGLAAPFAVAAVLAMAGAGVLATLAGGVA